MESSQRLLVKKGALKNLKMERGKVKLSPSHGKQKSLPFKGPRV